MGGRGRKRNKYREIFVNKLGTLAVQFFLNH